MTDGEGALESTSEMESLEDIQLLEMELENAVAKEDYAHAARLRDRLTSLKTNSTLGERAFFPQAKMYAPCPDTVLRKCMSLHASSLAKLVNRLLAHVPTKASCR